MPVLPLGRPRTYVDGIPLVPDDLNAIFDEIIAAYAVAMANVSIVIPQEHAVALGVGADGYPVLGTGTAWRTYAGPPAANKILQYPIIVPQGMVIKSWSLACEKASAATESLNATLYKRTGVGVGAAMAVIGAGQTNATNAPGDIALGQATTQPVAAGEAYTVHANSTTGTAGDYFGDLTVVYGRP